MAVTVFKTFSSGETLTASDLNSSLTQFTNNGEDFGTPWTKAHDADGNEFVMDSDGDSSITADSDDIFHFRMQGNDLFILNGAPAGAVNGLQMTASASSDPVALIVQGTGTNVDVEIRSKGSGDVVLADDSGNEILVANDVASAVNEITVENAVAGEAPEIQATGGDTDIDIDLIPKGTGTVKIAGTAMNFAGKQTIWVPAAAMRPTVSNGCAALTDVETTSARPDMTVLDFATGADDFAQFQVAFPKQWALGTVTFQAFWTAADTDTGGVTWALKGVAVADNDTIDVAFGTAVTVDDTSIGVAEDLHVTAESGAVTIAGTPADDELCFFHVFRDVSDTNDDRGTDARLIGIKFFLTTDLGNDD